MLDDPKPQPFLPRIGMIWFFIAVTIVAIALGVVRAAEQGRSLAAAMVFTVIFVGLCAMLSAACFLTAFLLGALEKAIVGPQESPANPFSDGSLPEQIVPPNPADSI